YEQIEAKHKYIAAKLLTIFVEHPIFFIGYSLGDEDIRNILNDIQLSLTSEQLKEIEDRLFYVVWDETEKNYTSSSYTINFDNGRNITITQLKLNDYSILYHALSLNKAKYPIKMLRHVKEDMYNLVLTNDPKGRMLLSLPEKELSKEEMEQVEFVYGFGIMERAKNGYQLVTSEEIFRDAVFDDGNFECELLVIKTLPYALPRSGGCIPIRKYASKVQPEKYPQTVVNNLNRFNTIEKILPQSLLKKRNKLRNDMTFEEAINSSEKLKNLAIVPYTKENIELLGNYLRSTLSKEEFKTNGDIRRLIRIYDLIKFK
ncbi:hypothetical protein VD175_002685, partial [Enterococcus faecium]|nr:hypothetical protein [Enterococcus faecium]